MTTINSTTEQPSPKPNESPAIWDLVLKDIAARDELGRQRYGVRLQAHNGRDAMVDLYQELLDAVVYARQVIAERDGNAESNSSSISVSADADLIEALKPFAALADELDAQPAVVRTVLYDNCVRARAAIAAATGAVG